jgi:hypothetical protein
VTAEDPVPSRSMAKVWVALKTNKLSLRLLCSCLAALQPQPGGGILPLSN